jgi:hypothetical protein
MTEDKYNEIKAKIDKIERDVKDGTVNSAQYVLEEMKKIWKEIIEASPVRTDVTPPPDDSPCKENSFF